MHDYRPKERSVSSGQLLMRDYGYKEEQRAVREQMEGAVVEIVAAGMGANHVSLFVGLFKEVDLYYIGGFFKTLSAHTDSLTQLACMMDGIVVERVEKRLPIRRPGVTLLRLLSSYLAQTDFFDASMTSKERNMNVVINRIIKRFECGVLMRGTSFMSRAIGC